VFIREIKKENGSISVRIVENVRKGKKISQRIVRIIGQAKLPHELEAFRELAKQSIVHMKQQKQPVLPFIPTSAVRCGAR
jgi:hypothetical protein